jgi:ketosteroid isomerase-like protein
MTERSAQDQQTVAIIRELEQQRIGALVSRDIATARVLHADDYELISGSGGRLSGDDYLAGIESGELRYAVFEPASPLVVRAYADVAVVRYLARIEIHFAGGRDMGQFWHTDLYEHRDGRWQVVWSQATPDLETRAGGYRADP